MSQNKQNPRVSDLNQYGEELHWYARKLGQNPDDAKDVVQSVFMKMVEAQQSGDRKAILQPRAYCYAVLRNEVIDISRKKKRRRLWLAEKFHALWTSQQSPWASEPFDDISSEEQIERLLGELSDFEKKLFMEIARNHKLSDKEIAARVGLPIYRVRTARRRIWRVFMGEQPGGK